MRVLGIETSSRRGSVALVEAGRLVAYGSHEQLNAHAERLLPLVDQVLAEAGWDKRSLERIAVGIGPGSFTGLRVGIAFAQGVSLGLGIGLVGVGSLEAMARAVPRETPGTRVALLDARRGEVFAAAYSETGEQRLEPRAIARDAAIAELAGLIGPGAVLLGEVVRELGGSGPQLPHADLPDALGVALLGAERTPAGEVEPLYVRDAGATPQVLPESPFRG